MSIHTPTASKDESLFQPIGAMVEQDQAPSAEGDELETSPVQEVESLCMECHQTGTTRLLLTMIPYFKEVILMSFRCPHCGNSNTEIQSASEIQERGSLHTLHITSPDDLDRQIVKSERATVTLPEFALTVPEGRGQLTTVEGLIRDTIRDLRIDQPLRKVLDADTHDKIEALITRLHGALGSSYNEDEEEPDLSLAAASERSARPDAPVFSTAADAPAAPFTPFTVLVRDPSGNSHASFKGSPMDPKWSFRSFPRTREENIALGLVNPDEEEAAPAEGEHVVEEGEVPEEVLSFPGNCSSCGRDCPTLMKKVNIPYFKDILLMSTHCHNCGYKDNEIKSGGAISTHGKRITLKVEDLEDLSRDILKSETAGLSIPEISLTLQPGTLGGRFTTLEGLLSQVYDELSTKAFVSGRTAGGGDSLKPREGESEDIAQLNEFELFLGKLKNILAAEEPFTVILDDPLANSYMQNLYAPDPDPNMTIEEYTRSFEQDEDLGLNDIKVEGYEEDAEKEEAPVAAP